MRGHRHQGNGLHLPAVIVNAGHPHGPSTEASLTINGFAKGDEPLARSRAAAVRAYLGIVFGLHVTIKTNTVADANSVTIVTDRE